MELETRHPPLGLALRRRGFGWSALSSSMGAYRLFETASDCLSSKHDGDDGSNGRKADQADGNGCDLEGALH